MALARAVLVVWGTPQAPQTRMRMNRKWRLAVWPIHSIYLLWWREEKIPYLEAEEELSEGVLIFQQERLKCAYKINGNDSAGAKVESGGEKWGDC